eukprot:c23491_g1_i2 orf=350-835(+)
MERDMKSSQLVQQEKKEEEEEKVSSTGHPVHHHHTIKRSSHKRSRYMKRKRSTRRRPSRMHLLSSLYQTLHDKLQAARVLLSPPFDTTSLIKNSYEYNMKEKMMSTFQHIPKDHPHKAATCTTLIAVEHPKQEGQDWLEPEDLRISIITALLNHVPYAPLG